MRGVLCGLGWIDATVVKFDSESLPLGSPLPHMGWNNLDVVKEDPLFAGLNDSKFYYLHSFYIVPKNQEEVIGSARYGEKFCCVVRNDNIYGMQCHPEKSHSFGVRFLKKFCGNLNMLAPRIIPCLLLSDGGLVKTQKFTSKKYVGDPINAIRIFNEKECDELMVLDIDASINNVEPNYAKIKKYAAECRMPLCYGGGIKTV